VTIGVQSTFAIARWARRSIVSEHNHNGQTSRTKGRAALSVKLFCRPQRENAAMKARGFALAGLAVLSACPLWAQEEPQGFSIGVGAGVGGGSLIGQDAEVTALPLLRYDSAAFSVGIPDGVRVTVIQRDPLRFSAVLSPRLSAIERSDAPELDGMTREVTADGGVQVDYTFGMGTRVSFRAVTELTDEHSGDEVTVGISHAIPLGAVPLIVGTGVDWQNGELSEYLYGVRADEAQAGREAYAPGDVAIPYLTIGTRVPLSDNLGLVANVRASFLSDKITDSPIIDEDVAVDALVGLTFRF
jgi:MipA family protein